MKFTLSFIALVVIFVGCKQAPPSTVSNEVKRIDLFLQDAVDRQRIPGLTVSATRNDSAVYTGAFGFRNVNTKEPMKPGYDFHWASVSKTFVATAIMQLVEKGQMKLDEKLIAYVPYFKQKGEDYKDITIRQVLNHTSGIGDVNDYEWDKPQNDEAAPERYVRSLENDEMLFKPGTDWSYSNTAYEILGVVITRVSGMPFETYVRKNIFEPLEMMHSSFIYPDIPDSLRVSGHVWAAKPMVSKVYPYNKIHAPSSTLNSNVLEMTHYAMAHLHRGQYKTTRILSDSTYDLLWTNSVNLPDKPAVGVSWFLDEHRGRKTASHSGGDTGFASFLLLVPEKNISVMIASNYDVCPTDEFAYAVLDLLLGEKPDEIKRPIGFSFAEVLAKEGSAKAISFYERTKDDSLQSKYFVWEEGSMGYPGRVLLEQAMPNEALEVFKFNLELRPTSGYAFRNLGVAYARLGNKELARINLTKALTILPDQQFIKDELKKLDQND